MEVDLYMAEAFKEANKALAIGEVPVGCVFIYRKEVIARGYNQVNETKNATRHAELICIEQVVDYCQRNNLRHISVIPYITVVVTVEPCIMCSAALHEIGVKEILFGCVNDRFGGKTVVDVPVVMRMGNRVKVTGGFCNEEAMALLKNFYKGQNPSAPVPQARN